MRCPSYKSGLGLGTVAEWPNKQEWGTVSDQVEEDNTNSGQLMTVNQEDAARGAGIGAPKHAQRRGRRPGATPRHKGTCKSSS